MYVGARNRTHAHPYAHPLTLPHTSLCTHPNTWTWAGAQDDQDGLFAKKSPAPARGSSLFADADLDEAGMDGKDAEDKDASAPAGGGEGAAVAGEGVGGQGKKKKANKKKR